MYEKLKGIVLNTIRYSDKHNIVHIYTDGRGLMSFAVPLGKTYAARMRNALLMPLSLVDLEAGVGRDVTWRCCVRCGATIPWRPSTAIP